MGFILLFSCLVGVPLVGFVIGMFSKDEEFTYVMFAVFLAALIFSAVVALPTAICQYNTALHMPFRIEALDKSIVQMREELASADSSFVQGMEGFQIKQSIQDAIVERNQILGVAKYYNRSSWFMFHVDIDGLE